MIDLRDTKLPDSIEFDGELFKLKTDFRVWIRFDHEIQHYNVAISDVFDGKIPLRAEAKVPLMEFYHSPNVTPKGTGTGERSVDMVWDGEYIVASFIQAYGIDLTTIEYMHWHVFKALLYALPDDTIMGKIMGYRTYQPTTKKTETIMQDLKRKWRLPTMEELQKRQEMLEWAEEMGL